MDIEKMQTKADKVFEVFNDLLSEYEEANPEFFKITALQIIYGAVLFLKTYIENPEEREITWDNPYVELQFPVEIDWDKLTPLIFTLTDKDLQDTEKLREILTEGFLKAKEMFVFRALCNDTALLKEGDNYELLLPADLIEELKKLPEKEREKTLQEIQDRVLGYDFKGKTVKDVTLPLPIKGKVTDIKGRERKFEAVLFWDFDPLVIDKDTKQAYYPVIVGLEFYRGYKPTRWSEKDRQEFWETLLKIIKDLIPEERFDFVLEPLPEPTVKAVSKETALVKASLHTELQKFGKPKRETQLTLFDFEKQKLTDGLPSLGLDLSLSQNKALFAIQKLLNDINYKGNLLGKTLRKDDNAFKYMGFLPQLEFTPTQYLEAYRVGKRETSRGKWEFNANERKEALKALYSLSEIKFKIAYKRRDWIEVKGKKEERIDVILTTSPLIKIMWGILGMTKEEERKYDRGQFTQEELDHRATIGIEPCPLLVDQIENYFILKPSSLFDDVKRLLGDKHSQYVPLFIEWLIAQAEIQRRAKTGWTIRINFKRLAEKLRIDSLIATRQWKRVRKILQECYKTARQLSYLLDYKTIQGATQEVEELTLNPEKFKRIRETQEGIKQIEAKKPAF